MPLNVHVSSHGQSKKNISQVDLHKLMQQNETKNNFTNNIDSPNNNKENKPKTQI